MYFSFYTVHIYLLPFEVVAVQFAVLHIARGQMAQRLNCIIVGFIRFVFDSAASLFYGIFYMGTLRASLPCVPKDTCIWML